MDNNVKQAMLDISMIKQVIERTKNDFSKISKFFIWIGIINTVDILFVLLSYLLFNRTAYKGPSFNVLHIAEGVAILAGYFVIFVNYRRKIKKTNNDISMGLLTMWGIILIGSAIFSLYRLFVPVPGVISYITTETSEHVEFSAPAYISLMQNIEVLKFTSLILGCLMIGIFTKKKIVVISTAIISILYWILFTGMDSHLTKIGNNYFNLFYSSILLKLILSIGMVLLGMELKKQSGGASNENILNTGSISD